MNLDQIDPKPIPADSSTVWTSATPPESTAFIDDEDPLRGPRPSLNSSVPWPGSTFIIRCATSGRVLTLREGKVLLAMPGERGSIHWACVETKGWLGFKNPVSGRFLGHDAHGFLRCSAERQMTWENFCVRIMPDGGYLLLMTHYERLWYVGTKVERSEERLAKVGHGGNDGIQWEFVKV